MKKILGFILLLGACVAQADTDSYLYWMLDTSDEYVLGNWDTAKLMIGDSSSWTMKREVVSVSENTIMDYSDFGLSYESATSIANDGSESFYVELYNGSDVLAHSGRLTITAGNYNTYIGKNTAMNPDGVSTYTFGNFVAGPIPEPNSAMLLMLGMSALALRRRQRA